MDHSNTLTAETTNGKPKTIKFTGRIRQALTVVIMEGIAARKTVLDSLDENGVGPREMSRRRKDLSELEHAQAWLNQRVERMDGPDENASV